MAPSVQPYVKPRIKDPGLDPVIKMTRDRRAKELEVETQKLKSDLDQALPALPHQQQQQ